MSCRTCSSALASTVPAGMPLVSAYRTEEEARQAPVQRLTVGYCSECDAHTSPNRGLDALLDTLVHEEDETAGEALEGWRERLDAANRRGERVVFWGHPTSAVGFLAVLQMGVPLDACVGTPGHGFLGGSAVPIVTVERLREDPPQLVVIVDDTAVDDVRAALDELEIAPRVFSLRG